MAALVKNTAKLAIAGGAVYVTLVEGVWSSTSQGSTALQKFRTRVIPTANEYWSRFPSVHEIGTSAVDTWNSGVQSLFGGISKSPDVASQYSKKAYEEVKRNLKP